MVMVDCAPGGNENNLPNTEVATEAVLGAIIAAEEDWRETVDNAAEEEEAAEESALLL